MNWFSRKPTQQKYVEAAITVASNLYLHTLSGTQDRPAPLQFNLPDSRYRYLIFCLSTAVTAALAYDEKKEVQPEVLIKGCLQFAKWTAIEHPQQYFDEPATSKASVGNGTEYLQQFLTDWSRWPKLEKENKNMEIVDLICSMIHAAESNEPAEQPDKQRLGQLALEIDCRLPAMRAAFAELANR